MVFIGGGRDHGVIIATDDRDSRMTGLAEGEVAVYSNEGDSIVLRRDNTIELRTKTLKLIVEEDVTVETKRATITASEKATIDAPDILLKGNVEIDGNLSQASGGGASSYTIRGDTTRSATSASMATSTLPARSTRRTAASARQGERAMADALLQQGPQARISELPLAVGTNDSDQFETSQGSPPVSRRVSLAQLKDGVKPDLTGYLTGIVGGAGIVVAGSAPIPTVSLEALNKAGTWGDGLHVPEVTVDDHGRVTNVVLVPITPTDLSAYALLDSPAFVGNPTAPMRPEGDSNAGLATTGWVQREIAPFLTDAPLDGNIYGRRDGEWIEAASPGEYVFSEAITNPPANGEVRLNDAEQTLATRIYFDGRTATGVYAYNMLRLSLTAGVKVLLQDKEDGARWLIFTATGDALGHDTWTELPVVLDSSSGSPLVAGARIIAFIASPAGGSFAPPGTITDFAGTTAPNGWLICNGQAVSRSQFNALFVAIGTLHGVGDGSTTFNVPDCRGRTRVGVDTTALRLTGYTTPGAVGGAEGVALTIAQLAAHTHADTGHTHGDSGHAHGFSDPGHNHGLVQSSHQHAPYPGGTGGGR